MSEERQCPVCGKALVQREGESKSGFQKRKTCGEQCRRGAIGMHHMLPDLEPRTCLACGDAFIVSRKREAKKRDQQRACSEKCRRIVVSNSTKQRWAIYRQRALSGKDRQCAACSRPLVPREGEAIAHFNIRKTCGGECASALLRGPRKSYPDKTCPQCRCRFGRRNSERASDYRKRVTCSKECGQKYGNRPLKDRPNYPYPREWNEELRSAIRRRDGGACVLCEHRPKAHDRKLAVHHIDHNKRNLDERNLISLCAPCHRRIHLKRWAGAWVAAFQELMSGGEASALILDYRRKYSGRSGRTATAEEVPPI